MEKFLRKIFGYGDGKFSELNVALSEREKNEAELNQKLRNLVSQIEKALNSFYGTKGTVSVFDWDSQSKKRVPLIYIATVIDKWETFAINGKIELNIMFHFDSTVHSERIEAVYSESVIKFVVGERTYTDIEEFCTVIESTVKNSLRLKG